MTESKPFKPLFDDIAREYAKHWRDLEFARSRLHEQRDALLDELAQRLGAALVKRGLGGHSGREETADFVSRYVDLEREFMKAKRSRGIDVRYLDGVQVSVRIGHQGHPELSAELYFRMKEEGLYDHVAIQEQTKSHAGGNHRYEDGYAYITVARMAIDTGTTLEQLTARVAALPQAFITADTALAKRYREKFNLSEDGAPSAKNQD